MQNKPDSTRRHFLLASAAAGGGWILPNTAPASIMSMLEISSLHPSRLIAGLVMSIVKAVVVELASDPILDALRNGKLLPNISLGDCFLGSCNDAGAFKHPNYKASLVVLGEANYESHKERQLKLLIENKQHLERMDNLLTYLRDEKIRARLSNQEFARNVGKDTEPDDLFTLDYLVMPNQHRKRHYVNMVEVTQSHAFDNWSYSGKG